MPLTLVWGKGFTFKTMISLTGKEYSELFGVDGGTVGVSLLSINESMEIARTYGVPEDLWPVYPDCDLDSEVPLDEVRRKSHALRNALAGVPSDVVEKNYWMSFIDGTLRQGHSFFVMA